MTPDMFTHNIFPINGIDIHVASHARQDLVPVATNGLVLFVHGWPESWFSWRHQMKAVSGAGYFAAALDVRGYGQSSKPHAVDEYRMSTITKDIVGVIDALGCTDAVLVGHDWGAPIVWNTALAFPERIRGVMGLSVPFMGRGDVPPLDLWKQLYTDKDLFFYQVYFQQEGIAEAELEADLEKTLRTMYYSASSAGMREGRAANLPPKPASANFLSDSLEPKPMPWISDEELAYYVEQFSSGGMRGPLNRYRIQNVDWQESEGKPQIIQPPAGFIAGEDDPVLSFVQGVDVVELQQNNFADLLSATIIPDAGHWVQQEKPEEVNLELLDFLAEV